MMFKLPVMVPYGIVAFNITACAAVAQLNFLVIDSPIAKMGLWILAAGAWALAYVKRNKYIVLSQRQHARSRAGIQKYCSGRLLHSFNQLKGSEKIRDHCIHPQTVHSRFWCNMEYFARGEAASSPYPSARPSILCRCVGRTFRCASCPMDWAPLERSGP